MRRSPVKLNGEEGGRRERGGEREGGERERERERE